MALEPQYSGSGGGLYPASSQSQIPGPVGANKIEGVPAPSAVGVDAEGQLRTPGLQSPVSGGNVFPYGSGCAIGDSFASQNQRVITLAPASVVVAAGIMTITGYTHGLSYSGKKIKLSGLIAAGANVPYATATVNSTTSISVPVPATVPEGAVTVGIQTLGLIEFGSTFNCGSVQRFLALTGAGQLDYTSGWPGYSTGELYDRIANKGEGVPSLYDWIVLDVSLANDIQRGDSAATIIANFTSLIAYARTKAPYVHVLGPALLRTDAVNNTAANRAKLLQVRAWQIGYCKSLGIGYTDRIAVVNDPLTSAAKAGFVNSNDKTHYTWRGSDECGRQLAKDWRLPIVKNPILAHGEDNNAMSGGKNIAGQAFFAIGAASAQPGITGTLLSGVTVVRQAGTPTVTISPVLRDDGAGYVQRMVITGAPDDQVRLSCNLDTGLLLAAGNAGTPLSLQYIRSITGISGQGVKNIYSQLVTTIDGNTDIIFDQNSTFWYNVADTPIKDTVGEVITMPDIRIRPGAACTLGRWDVLVLFASAAAGGAGGTVTVDIGAFELRKP